MQALGGAKNHMIVLPDADLDLAADSAVSAAYGSTGQRCMAISVLVAVGDVADRLLPKIRERLRKLKVAPGLEPGADMGPLVTREHFTTRRCRTWSRARPRAPSSSRTAAAAQSRATSEGFFLGPCLFDRVTPEMTIYTDEIFGPVLSVVRTDSYDEALRLVNESAFANGVAIFTNDGGAARRFQTEVQAGMVGINVPIPVPMAYYSFGGWKSSLFGDAHVYGREGIHFYTRGKVITSRWPDPRHRGVNLGFPQMQLTSDILRLTVVRVDRLVGVVVHCDADAAGPRLDTRGCGHGAAAEANIVDFDLDRADFVAGSRLRVGAAAANEEHRLVGHSVIVRPFAVFSSRAYRIGELLIADPDRPNLRRFPQRRQRNAG